jgi:hypothetical protein
LLLDDGTGLKVEEPEAAFWFILIVLECFRSVKRFAAILIFAADTLVKDTHCISELEGLEQLSGVLGLVALLVLRLDNRYPSTRDALALNLEPHLSVHIFEMEFVLECSAILAQHLPRFDFPFKITLVIFIISTRLAL